MGKETTSFEGMPHEQMIAWLDQANSAVVKAAADRLATAASAIEKIGEELKIRPQFVDWKGRGAESFRTWSADLANATLRLGEYSKGASMQLSHAADAIALAKAATPRPDAGTKANLDAALSVPNDPDSTTLVQKLSGALETDRKAAAKQLENLSQAYDQSVDGIGKLKKPEFPPPPQVISPDDRRGRESSSGHISGGGTSGANTGAGPRGVFASGQVASPSDSFTPLPVHSSVTMPVAGVSSQPVDMEIDGLATLPTSQTGPSSTPPAVPVSDKREGGVLPTPAVLPPSISGKAVAPPTTSVGGKASGMTRPPMSTGPTNAASGPLGRPPRDGGIVGGRPVAQSPGRPTGGIPRGTVVGSEGTQAGRGTAVGRGAGMGMGGIGSAGQSGIVGGRRLAGETGGMVSGRPQQPGRMPARPFTPGGTGLVRNGETGDGNRAAGHMGRGGAAASQRARDPRRDESERPDYLVEDEETWQQGGRRVVPPVID
ncbi:hypothetical protein [Streptomyces sp. NPDC017862]|uniref:hypothetical protein n=1 Tax=unclassified Streptomyces TaxID=2593676 RepID=UPI0037B27F5C